MLWWVINWPFFDRLLHRLNLLSKHRLVLEIVELINLIFHLESTLWLVHSYLIPNLVQILLRLLKYKEIGLFVPSKHLYLLCPLGWKLFGCFVYRLPYDTCLILCNDIWSDTDTSKPCSRHSNIFCLFDLSGYLCSHRIIVYYDLVVKQILCLKNAILELNY